MALILFWLNTFLGFIGLILTVWCVLFFRDSPRVTIIDPSTVVSPADGTIVFIGEAVPPSETEMGDITWLRISVFMSVFDGHVNRSPVPATIRSVIYKPGKFLNADLDKASEDNERNSVVFDGDDGTPLVVVQIAGLIARRIVFFLKQGDHVEAGERFGLIRFGSRVDVYVPIDKAASSVAIGQKVRAGETVLARIGTPSLTMTSRED